MHITKKSLALLVGCIALPAFSKSKTDLHIAANISSLNDMHLQLQPVQNPKNKNEQLIGWGHILTSQELKNKTIKINGNLIKYEKNFGPELATDLFIQDLEIGTLKSLEKKLTQSLSSNQMNALVAYAYVQGVESKQTQEAVKLVNENKLDKIASALVEKRDEDKSLTTLEQQSKERTLSRIHALWNKPAENVKISSKQNDKLK